MFLFLSVRYWQKYCVYRGRLTRLTFSQTAEDIIFTKIKMNAKKRLNVISQQGIPSSLRRYPEHVSESAVCRIQTAGQDFSLVCPDLHFSEQGFSLVRWEWCYGYCWVWHYLSESHAVLRMTAAEVMSVFLLIRRDSPVDFSWVSGLADEWSDKHLIKNSWELLDAQQSSNWISFFYLRTSV